MCMCVGRANLHEAVSTNHSGYTHKSVTHDQNMHTCRNPSLILCMQDTCKVTAHLRGHYCVLNYRHIGRHTGTWEDTGLAALHQRPCLSSLAWLVATHSQRARLSSHLFPYRLLSVWPSCVLMKFDARDCYNESGLVPKWVHTTTIIYIYIYMYNPRAAHVAHAVHFLFRACHSKCRIELGSQSRLWLPLRFRLAWPPLSLSMRQ